MQKFIEAQEDKDKNENIKLAQKEEKAKMAADALLAKSKVSFPKKSVEEVKINR